MKELFQIQIIKKLYIPYLEDDEYEKESQKLRDYIRKAEERLTPEIRDNKIASLFNDNLDQIMLLNQPR